MIKSIAKKILATLITLGSAGCSQPDNFIQPDNFFQQDSFVDSFSHKFGNFAVKFNTAYKGLYEENEKIGRAAPDNPDKLFRKIMDTAKKSLDIAIFDIEEPSTCHTLIDAQKRGVKVRIITDSDNTGEKNNPDVPRKILEEMKAAGIQIKEDKRSAFMHNKFVIMDDTVVLTGSMNLTSYSMYRDNNNSLMIKSPELAANYKAEFKRLFDQGMLSPNPHEIPYPHVNIEGVDVNVYFSPGGGTKDAVIQALNSAKKSIKFMAFSLTDKDIQQLLLDKVQAGVKVEGIFDGCMISKYSSYFAFVQNKIPVLIDGNQALLHDKAFIIDNKTVITGSYNFSKNAENNNNENTLIIKSSQIAGFYNSEFNRLKHASLFNKNLPPYDNRACSSTDSGNDISINLPDVNNSPKGAPVSINSKVNTNKLR